MDPVKVEIECRHRAEMLLNKYFGEIVHDAAVLHPETVDEKYYLGLPLEIEKAEFNLTVQQHHQV